MKNKYFNPFGFLLLMLFNSNMFAQFFLFSDNFESYIAGQQLACQNPNGWTTWNNSPCDTSEDPLIVNTISLSAPNCLKIVADNDLVKVTPNLTTGQQHIRFKMFIPTGSTGYWNVLQAYSGVSSVWGFQAYFDSNGTGTIDAGGAASATFTYTYNTWLDMDLFVNLVADQAEFRINNNLIHTYVWSTGAYGTGTLNQLGGVDFYGRTSPADLFYIDDFEISNPLPVELTSFTAKSSSGLVTLNWSTASELNNMGFEIQRKTSIGEFNSEWTMVAFKEGRGTTSETQNYIYVDDVSELAADAAVYRLKQIDYNGNFEYSPEVLVDNLVPLAYGLDQNYPNPFNPSTVIKYQLPTDNFVTLKVLNTLGQEVATLVNEIVTAGTHEVNFNADNLTSGVYYYVLRVSQANGSEQVFTNKMMLLK